MTPQLRFPEFTDEWQVKKLGDVFDRVTRKNKENNQNILTISAQDGLVSQEKFFSKIVASKDVSGYYLLHKNDYAYNKSYSKGYPMGAIKRLSRDEKGVVSTLYICFSSKQGLELFFDQYFEAGRLNTEIEKIAQEGARNHGLLNMAVGDFFTTKLVIPVSKPEQEKIADFLTAVDERIGVSEKKLELLETYKRGVMQKIFSQQVRFKDDDGNPYPDWEEKKLGEIGETYNGLTGKAGDDFGNGSPFITYMQIFSNSKISGKFGKVRISANEKQNFVKYGDIFFTTSSETPEETGFTSVLLDNLENTYLNSFCFGYRVSKNQLLPEFARYLFHSVGVRSAIVRLAQGSTRYNISKRALMNMTIFLPSHKEQQKIATLLTAIDDKITAEQSKLTAAKQFKKALLQRMFV